MTQQPEWRNNDGGQQPQGQPDHGQQPGQQPPQYGAPESPQYGPPQPGAYQQQPASPYGQPAYGGGLYAPFVPRPGVGFVDAIKLGFRNYANFKGRAARSEYWWWFLFHSIIAVLPLLIGYIVLIAGIFGQMHTTRSSSSSAYMESDTVQFTAGMGFGVALMVIGGLIALALLVPTIALTWRRLHDAGFPGPMFFLSFIPTVGGIILIVLCALPSKPEGMKYEMQ